MCGRIEPKAGADAAVDAAEDRLAGLHSSTPQLHLKHFWGDELGGVSVAKLHKTD